MIRAAFALLLLAAEPAYPLRTGSKFDLDPTKINLYGNSRELLTINTDTGVVTISGASLSCRVRRAGEKKWHSVAGFSLEDVVGFDSIRCDRVKP